MRLTGRDILDKFKRKHPQSRAPLAAWEALIQKNTFTQFPDLKRTFGTADYVKPETVFDVSGNKYRVIARVEYHLQAVAVKAVMTHEGYDRWRK